MGLDIFGGQSEVHAVLCGLPHEFMVCLWCLNHSHVIIFHGLRSVPPLVVLDFKIS